MTNWGEDADACADSAVAYSACAYTNSTYANSTYTTSGDLAPVLGTMP